MFTLVTKNSNRKTILVYLVISVFTVLIERIYSIFGHGVYSGYMTWMFLYPFLGGVLYYLLLGYLIPLANQDSGYRLFYNIYNSGIALLTVGSFMQGIFEIAGTNSSYTIYYFISGAIFCVIGMIHIFLIVRRLLTPHELQDR